MRKRVLSSLALCLLMVGLWGCSQRSGGGKAGDYQIYYSALSNQNAPLAVECETWTPEAGEQIIPGLLEALLAGPTDPELASPFPDGTRLLGWTLEEGCLRLDLSEQYGDLTGPHPLSGGGSRVGVCDGGGERDPLPPHPAADRGRHSDSCP